MNHIYADFIDRVAKPARYLGGEYQSVAKNPADVRARVALAFPDVYEIGMSHMGTKILYSLLNKHADIACERAFAPWVDMEAELRERNLPLVTLETQSPLSEMDVIGFSIQYELTFTNALNVLDLGGVPLRTANRKDSDPLVIGGGPTATHPEPIAPFFDALFIGEAEAELPDLCLAWSAMRRSGRARADALAELASRFSIYVPSLYAEEICKDTGMTVVGKPLDARVPARVRRAVIDDIDQYPFPSDAPVPYAEAVFDRAGVEIARGCTEGCRFCQAGMIYRPVRERSPESILHTIGKSVSQAGYDETSLTSLSTADYSAITPLVKAVAKKLEGRRVSMSVSSLRAYGLGEDILDEIAKAGINGLTFAPEAGTQRMRDVVNKNVTEAHIAESSERVFARGWHRLKLYFMIGLPTEQDDDVVGIIDTGERMLRIGRRFVGKKGEVTVSVSSHVPKPHTPFQWCAQDPADEIERKQRLLRGRIRERGLRLKVHDASGSFVEGVLARGDRRLADAIELAWQRGARFDGWDELFDADVWRAAFAETGVDLEAYLGTRPISARLPWDHIDVGLEDGFLLAEYRKALKDRLSPPCGKVAGSIIHHNNLEDAEADAKRLVCYDCGVACDLANMREARLVKLRTLGAAAPIVRESIERKPARGKRKPPVREIVEPRAKFRIRYTKLGRVAYLGHLDTARVLIRLFRRADVELAYTSGFRPKPKIELGPALSLGIASFGELIDVSIMTDISAEALQERLSEVAPEGMSITGVWKLGEQSRGLGKLISGYDLLVAPPRDGAWQPESLVAEFLARPEAMVHRGKRQIDVRPFVEDMTVMTGEAVDRLGSALGWADVRALIRCRITVAPDGSAKPREIAEALGGESLWPADPRSSRARLARLGLCSALTEKADTLAPWSIPGHAIAG